MNDKAPRAVGKMTRKEAEIKIDLYKEIFSVVQLVVSSDSYGFETQKCDKCCEGSREENAEDIKPGRVIFCKKRADKPCAVCIVNETFAEKKSKIKIEYFKDRLYQVMTEYIEIEDVPHVILLANFLDDNTLPEFADCSEFVERVTEYTDKLYKDALTGAYNRRYYEDEVKNLTNPAGVALIDLDDLKVSNDLSGHHAGDQALSTAVLAMKKSIRDSDMLIRYGGDEFLLVVPHIKKDSFKILLNRIKSNVYSAIVPEYPDLQLSVSIGGVISDEGETVEKAVLSADKLMYIAKNCKNTVITEWDDPDQSASDETDAEYESMKQKILIVDDSAINRALLSEMLKKDFSIIEASSGRECLDILTQYGTAISLVMLDLVIPDIDGIEVLRRMDNNGWTDDIPVIIISSEDSYQKTREAYDAGASDYIRRPYDAKVVYQRVMNIIKLYAKQKRLMAFITEQYRECEKNNHMMIDILSNIVEFRNGESGLHVLHINKLTKMLLNELVKKTDRYKLSRNDCEAIVTASALHDIGKIGIDEKILNKHGRLTDDEYAIMKQHTVIGENILKNLKQYEDEPFIKTAMHICRWHHERYDGKGYPDGLKGDEIPISAQIVALADVYDALTSERVYKKAYSHEKAMQMIMNGECGAFSSLLLECLTDIQYKIRDALLPEMKSGAV